MLKLFGGFGIASIDDKNLQEILIRLGYACN
jgi:hypothetical protein